MSTGQPTQAQTLLIKAAEDEETLGAPNLSDSILGFHAQQAVEKLIKALLAQLNVPFELTHNLGRLQVVLASPDVTDLMETVRVIREHIVTRIAALSANP